MQDDKTTKKDYGILMRLVFLNNGVYAYIPTFLVEGNNRLVDGEFYVDDVGMSYLSIHDSTLLHSDMDLAVGYVISEEDLLKKYDGCTLLDAKAEYWDDISSYYYFGFYVEDLEKIVTISLDLECVDSYFNALGLNNEQIEDRASLPADILAEAFAPALDNSSVDDVYQMPGELEFRTMDGDKMIPVAISEINDLLRLNDFKQLKVELEKIRDMDRRLLFNPGSELSSVPNPVSDNTSTEKVENDSSKEAKNKKSSLFEKLDIKKIKQIFDERIIGQEEAKRDIISAVYMNELTKGSLNRNSCLLIGPTGSGKTLITMTAAKCFNKPLVEIDMTQLSAPGYVGANLEDFLAQLIDISGGDLEKAQNGIVVLNEIDKKGSESNGDVSGRGVLNCLLPFFEGTTYTVNYHERKVLFDTSNLTIFATGAFADLVKKKKKDSKNSIGFNTGSFVSKNDDEDISYVKIESEDLVEYGNIPRELVGRIPVITQLSGHTISSLKTILTESNVSPLLAEVAKLNSVGLDLSWKEDFLESAAQEAFKKKEGARSLKKVVEQAIKNARWYVFNNLDKYKGIILTKESVMDNEECILVDNDWQEYSLKEVLNRESIEEKVKVKSLAR